MYHHSYRKKPWLIQLPPRANTASTRSYEPRQLFASSTLINAKCTSFITSHFYLDDFVQSSEDPNPRPLQHTPLQAIPEDGFRTPAEEATDEDVRLARRYQGYGGTR